MALAEATVTTAEIDPCPVSGPLAICGSWLAADFMPANFDCTVFAHFLIYREEMSDRNCHEFKQPAATNRKYLPFSECYFVRDLKGFHFKSIGAPRGYGSIVHPSKSQHKRALRQVRNKGQCIYWIVKLLHLALQL